MKKIVTILSLVFTSFALQAQTMPVGCLASADTSKMYSCLEKRYRMEDQALQKVYDSLITQLKERGSDERAKTLRVAELSWIRFRDAQCKFDYGVAEAGDQSGTALQMCLIRETSSRLLQLEQILTHLVTGSVIPQ